jgi:hypothetical protein
LSFGVEFAQEFAQKSTLTAHFRERVVGPRISNRYIFYRGIDLQKLRLAQSATEGVAVSVRGFLRGEDSTSFVRGNCSNAYDVRQLAEAAGFIL